MVSRDCLQNRLALIGPINQDNVRFDSAPALWTLKTSNKGDILEIFYLWSVVALIAAYMAAIRAFRKEQKERHNA
jgi:hypothetical protein